MVVFVGTTATVTAIAAAAAAPAYPPAFIRRPLSSTATAAASVFARDMNNDGRVDGAQTRSAAYVHSIVLAYARSSRAAASNACSVAQ
jgi:hypothetical protein